MESSELLSQLNEQQHEAVVNTDGALLILAGAGSGKTRVIAHRIAYLISEKGVAPWNILAVTFTNKAAEEMRLRVQRLLRGKELSLTFSSLRANDDSLRLVKQCIKDLGYDEKYLGPRATQSAISAAKNRGEDVDAFAAHAEYIDERRAAMARVYKAYEERLHVNNALDFDDLLIKAVRLLRDVAEVREKYNNKFRYILVDEYQDTNKLQAQIVRLLTATHDNVAVVGDALKQMAPAPSVTSSEDRSRKYATIRPNRNTSSIAQT